MSDFLDIELPTLEAIEDEERLRDLVQYVPHLSPQYMAPTHLAPLLRRFELAVDGIPQRVCCTAPPRHGKTESVLHVPAFTLRRHPELTLSYSTYADRLSRSKSRKARRLVHASGIETFGSVNEWRTEDGGGLLAGGVGGPLTGHGVNCLAEGTMVATPSGPRAIESLAAGDSVWTFNVDTGAVESGVVMATRTATRPTMRMTTGHGVDIECTDDHRIYSGEFKEASALVPGDALVRLVSEELYAAGACREEAGGAGMCGRLLFGQMHAGASRHQECAEMCFVCEANAGEKGAPLLLKGVQASPQDAGGQGLRALQSQVPPEITSGGVLLASVCGCAPCTENGRPSESELQAREELLKGVQRCVCGGQAEGLASLPRVWCRRAEDSTNERRADGVDVHPGGAPPQRRHDRQQTGEPLHHLQGLPSGAPQVKADSVSVVGPGRLTRVVDIEVSGNHNFFANGVLVHNCAIVDDPIKNRAEAESAVKRGGLVDWMRDVLLTRIEPGGSVFVFMTRWHPDDLVGTLVDEGFECINLPAISEDGAPLWPERWPLDALRAREVEVGAYTWASLYQGQPRPRGSRVFEGVTNYAPSGLPVVYSVAAGVDSAYSMAKTADYSAYVEMKRAGEYYYVTDARRVREPMPQFKGRLRVVHERHPSMRWRWYVATSELGAASLFAEGENGVPMHGMVARADKFVRALRYAAAWNAGKVLLPERAPWLEDFVSEHAGFTGVNDKRDDLVDAAVAAFDELSVETAKTSMGVPDRAPVLRSVGM